MTNRELCLKAQGIARLLTFNEEPQGDAKRIIGELVQRLWNVRDPSTSLPITWADFWLDRGDSEAAHNVAAFELAEPYALACVAASREQEGGTNG